jgi:phytoene dehydrogenase-like protein
VPLAHALDGARTAVLHRSLDETAAGLGADAEPYRKLFAPFVAAGLDLTDGLLSPLRVPPKHPVTLARFGAVGTRSARSLDRRFETDEARALFAGVSAHAMLPFGKLVTGGYGLFLASLAHVVGWPMARGGSQAIADALVAELARHGGRVECGQRVQSLAELPARTVLLDVTPRQLIEMAGRHLPDRYRRRLGRFRYGNGVFKVDWLLDGPIPWRDPACSRAGTVHVGGTADEVVAVEAQVHRGQHPERPFVILAQQSLFDPTRAPAGMQTAWAYCHVPAGSTVDMTDRIEDQIERFAPGFRERVLERHTMNTVAMHAHDANFIGGDIIGGAADLRQFFARPVLSLHPWRTPLEGVYLCSSSTPPGGGVHGMCGWHAAQQALRRNR